MRIVRGFMTWIDGHRVQCPICKTWWETDQEAGACFSSHY